ncbi:MAG: bacillithiol system redox-active protein YtxJ [Bacteroidota bacterium]
MNLWKDFRQTDQLATIIKQSFERPQLIFKHSISCGISAQIRYQLESASEDLSEIADLHYLDLINFRPTSNLVANQLGVPHQSPQVLLIKDGKVVYHSSHFGIRTDKIMAAVA